MFDTPLRTYRCALGYLAPDERVVVPTRDAQDDADDLLAWDHAHCFQLLEDLAHVIGVRSVERYHKVVKRLVDRLLGHFKTRDGHVTSGG